MIFRNEFVTNAHNTTAPTDNQLQEFWHNLGVMGEGVWPSKHPVTPISKHVFVGAKHVGAQVGDKINYRGKMLNVTKVEASKTADINYIYVVEELTPVPVFNGEKFLFKFQLGTGESLNEVFCIGFGYGKFRPVNNESGQLIGWHANTTQEKRWGINHIHDVNFNTSGVDFYVSPGQIPAISCRFQIGTYEDFHATPGDSGGPAFVYCEDKIWRFVGVIHSDGGQPATFGKWGCSISTIHKDLDYIRGLEQPQPKPFEKDSVQAQPQPNGQFDYIGREKEENKSGQPTGRKIILDTWLKEGDTKKLLSSQEFDV